MKIYCKTSVTVLALLCIARLSWCEADQSSKMTSEMVHVGEAMVAISTILAISLNAHKDEKSVCTYASKIASANVSLVKMMKPPKEAEDLHRHLKEMAERFAKAVEFYGKGDYEAADEVGQDVKQAASKAKAELDGLKRKGIIP